MGQSMNYQNMFFLLLHTLKPRIPSRNLPACFPSPLFAGSMTWPWTGEQPHPRSPSEPSDGGLLDKQWLGI